MDGDELLAIGVQVGDIGAEDVGFVLAGVEPDGVVAVDGPAAPGACRPCSGQRGRLAAPGTRKELGYFGFGVFGQPLPRDQVGLVAVVAVERHGPSGYSSLLDPWASAT